VSREQVQLIAGFFVHLIHCAASRSDGQGVGTFPSSREGLLPTHSAISEEDRINRVQGVSDYIGNRAPASSGEAALRLDPVS